MPDVNKHIDNNAKAGYIDWLRNEGPAPDQSIIEHVTSCFDCKKEILELSEMLDTVDGEAKIIKKKGKSKQIDLKLMIKAVAILMGVMAVALIIQFLRPEPENLEIAVSQDILEADTVEKDTSESVLVILPEKVVIIKHDTILYAANFAPNGGLDILVDAKFRSVEKDKFEKDQFKEIYKKGENLKVKFAGMIAQDIEFVLVSNTGSNLITIKVENSEVSLDLKYEPGLYYWKIVVSDELFMVGKFKILT